MNTPDIPAAMTAIESLADWFQQRGMSAPTAAEVAPLISFANARGAKLTQAQWSAAWRLGREGLAAVVTSLRCAESFTELTDAQWKVKASFKPWRSYDCVTGRPYGD